METIEDVISALRAAGQNEWADRVEAAHKREVDEDIGMLSHISDAVDFIREALAPVLAVEVGKMTAADCILAVAQAQRIYREKVRDI